MNNYLLRAIFQYGKVIKLWGHVGTYAKGAPRVCGGQNQNGTVVSTCYEYNAKENNWEEMPDMKYERFRGEALIDNEQEMWVGPNNTLIRVASSAYF